VVRVGFAEGRGETGIGYTAIPGIVKSAASGRRWVAAARPGVEFSRTPQQFHTLYPGFLSLAAAGDGVREPVTPFKAKGLSLSSPGRSETQQRVGAPVLRIFLGMPIKERSGERYSGRITQWPKSISRVPGAGRYRGGEGVEAAVAALDDADAAEGAHVFGGGVGVEAGKFGENHGGEGLALGQLAKDGPASPVAEGEGEIDHGDGWRSFRRVRCVWGGIEMVVHGRAGVTGAGRIFQGEIKGQSGRNGIFPSNDGILPGNTRMWKR